MERVKLGDICEIAAGQGAPQGSENYCSYPEGIPFIKAGDLGDLLDGKSELEIQCVSPIIAKEYKLKLYPAGSILFAKSGMSCMKGYVYRIQNSCYIVSHLAIVMPYKVDGNYLKYYFQYNKPNLLIKDSAYPSISLQDISNMELKLPSFEEQKAIAGKLDKVSGLIEKRKTQLEKLDLLIKSRFVEMFDGKGYPQVTIGELVTSKVPSVKKVFTPTDVIKYIDISSIDNIRNVMTGYTEYVLQEAPSRAQQHIKKGDIVISTVRPNLKNVAITTYEDDNLVASSGFCVLRANKCLPSYLMAIVCSEKFTEAMIKLVTGANYPAIKDSDVLNYVVALPPIKIQEQFASFVEQIDKSKFEIQKSLEKLEILKKSLMQQYFG